MAKGKFKPGSKKRENKCIVMFNEKDRVEYLTGFHKRKVERRKAAAEEIKVKIKEEQKRVREERQKEYQRQLEQREEALDEAENDGDELEDAITGQTESIQYDHPNHTVTVTTISDLDLTGASLLAPTNNRGAEEREEGGEVDQRVRALPKKSGDPILNKKIKTLTAYLHAHSKRKKGAGRGQADGRARGRPGADKRSGASDRTPGAPERKSRAGRTGRRQRRRLTGKKVHHKE